MMKLGLFRTRRREQPKEYHCAGCGEQITDTYAEKTPDGKYFHYASVVDDPRGGTGNSCILEYALRNHDVVGAETARIK